MEVTYFLQSFANEYLDFFFLNITKLSETMLVIVLLGFIYWCTDKKFAYPFAASVTFSLATNNMFKNIFKIERPFNLNDPKLRVVEEAVPAATGYSFPSGHTQLATVVYGTLGFHLKRIFKFLCFAAVILVGISRIYLGVHTVYDVVFALIIGSASSAFVMFTYNKFVSKSPWLILIYTLPAFLCVAFLDTSFLGDTFKTFGISFGAFLGMAINEKYIDFDSKGSVKKQVLKMVLGIAVALIIQGGLKAVFSLIATTGAISHILVCIRYFLIGFWIAAGFPFVIKKYLKNID
ncbi:MAG: phosphatase PAP2 family protein [Ruminococcaceae bacterium]|nr:phosphatase PAP2 family protein [Oscillospiraceae bacterium]